MGPTDIARSVSGRALLVRALALLTSVMVVAFVVITGSRAAFSDTTDNTGNGFVAGTLQLVDDDAASAMFSVTDMIPGQVVTECILVTYSAGIPDPQAVRLYSGGYTDSGNFADYLNVTVDEGTGATFGDCSTFTQENTIVATQPLSTFDATYTDYASGAGVWDPASVGESKAYRFTIELDSATPNAEQGESVSGLTFVWEVQS